MKVTITIEGDIDPELLAAHDGRRRPPPNDFHQWEMSDFQAAIDYGILTLDAGIIEIERQSA